MHVLYHFEILQQENLRLKIQNLFGACAMNSIQVRALDLYCMTQFCSSKKERQMNQMAFAIQHCVDANLLNSSKMTPWQWLGSRFHRKWVRRKWLSKMEPAQNLRNALNTVLCFEAFIRAVSENHRPFRPHFGALHSSPPLPWMDIVQNWEGKNDNFRAYATQIVTRNYVKATCTRVQKFVAFFFSGATNYANGPGSLKEETRRGRERLQKNRQPCHQHEGV